MIGTANYEHDVYGKVTWYITWLAGEVASKATTPCAPLEKGNALVAWDLVANENRNNKKQISQLKNIKIKITNEKKSIVKMLRNNK